MTHHTRTTTALFRSVKVHAVNAIFAIYDREAEALDANRPLLARQMHRSRERLCALLLEIRRAEVVFSRSAAAPLNAETNLRDLTRTLRRANTLLSSATTAQEGADSVACALIDLAAQFK